MASDNDNKNLENMREERKRKIVVRTDSEKFYFSSKRKYLALKREFERKAKKST